MATRADLPQWVLEALGELGGSAHAVDVAKAVWRRHEPDLRASGDLFYTWQYDLRWAGTKLRKQGLLAGNARGERWSVVRHDAWRGIDGQFSQASSGLVVGGQYPRRELNHLFGGQTQGGIVTPKSAPYILIFSSPEGWNFGYHDWWESDDIFRYFGQGRFGDMEFKRGNKAIRESAKYGKSLLLFTCENQKASTRRFEGEFHYAGYEWIENNADARGELRRAICFRIARGLAHA